MTLVKVNHRNHLPTFVDRFFSSDPFALANDLLAREARFVPAVNIQETDKAFVVSLAAPGRKKEDFKLEVHDKVLTISSEQQETHSTDEEQAKYLRREFRLERFQRSFSLSEQVAEEQISARYEGGVLYIELPKKEEARSKSPRLIDIA